MDRYVADRMVIAWLGVLCAILVAMVVVGGVTRLTGSGLSMVDWRPITGALPPLNESEWQAVFEAYKQYPQYEAENAGMDLEAFKGIFFWEYFHRLLGRAIGLIFFVPLVIFWLRGQIEHRFKVPLVIALVLGGSQGLLGWYMVQSGLVDIPRVSHYRLAAHLSLALAILAYLFWLMLSMARVPTAPVGRSVALMIWVLAGLLVAQIVYGAFTAGIRAGYGYNTWPLMNGEFMAPAVFFMKPWWINLFESTATIQFIHRWLAVVVVVVAVAVWIAVRNQGVQIRWAAALFVAALFCQFGIGVLTLVHVVPLSLGVLHQGWACVVLLALVYLAYAARPLPRT